MDILLALLIVIIFVICGFAIYCFIWAFHDLQTIFVARTPPVVPVNDSANKNEENYVVFIQPTREIVLGISK